MGRFKIAILPKDLGMKQKDGIRMIYSKASSIFNTKQVIKKDPRIKIEEDENVIFISILDTRPGRNKNEHLAFWNDNALDGTLTIEIEAECLVILPKLIQKKLDRFVTKETPVSKWLQNLSRL